MYRPPAARSLKCSPMSCRKPPLLARFLSEQIPNSVMSDGIVPRATWKANPAIQEWGLCWRENAERFAEVACSFLLKGNMMPGHGYVVAVFADLDRVHIMICLNPIGNPNGEPDYIAIMLPVQTCSENVCGEKAMARGMTFQGDHPADAEELAECWESIKAERDQHNAVVLKDLEKGKKKTPTSRRQVSRTAAAEDEAVVAEVAAPSKPKRKAKGKDDANKILCLTLDEALVRANHLTTKTKDNEVNAIYQALEKGLLHAFPYKKERLPGKIFSDRLHIAPDELKYRKLAKDRLGQVKTMYKGYGSIRKKPEIHGIPLKRAPLPTDRGLDAVMDSMPAEHSQVYINGETMPWWKAPDVHWYIIGGQHTVTACRELAEQLPAESEARKDLLEFEVIPVFSRDTNTLVRVSNALNLNIAEKVAKENFRSCAEMGRAAWVKAGCPEPHRGGGKPTAAFEAAKLNVMAHFVDEKVSSKLPLIFVKARTWELWTEVFDAWENGELVGDDGSVPDNVVVRKPLTHITKTDLVPTLGLRDSDLCDLVDDILNHRVSIKNTSKARSSGKVTLFDWCKDKKLDRVVMNEIMWTRKKYPLPCKDAAWVPYTDEAWLELANAEGYSPAVVRNVWKDVKKFTDGSNWLNGRVNPMNPTTDKSIDGKAPGVFFTTLSSYASVQVAHAPEAASELKYECLEAETLDQVCDLVQSLEGCGDIEPGSKKMVVLFAYSEDGQPLGVRKQDLQNLTRTAEVPEEVRGGRNRDAYVPFPMLLIGGSRFLHTVVQTSYSSQTSWYFHTVYYEPAPRCGFEKDEMEPQPLVCLNLTYPKPENRSTMLGNFMRFTGMSKALDWFHKDVDGEVDWNGGKCGVGHGLLEQLLKPTLKAKEAILLNIWGGGNITEIGLRNGRTVLEFVREEGGKLRAEKRVQGMNLISPAQVRDNVTRPPPALPEHSQSSDLNDNVEQEDDIPPPDLSSSPTSPAAGAVQQQRLALSDGSPGDESRMDPQERRPTIVDVSSSPSPVLLDRRAAVDSMIVDLHCPPPCEEIRRDAGISSEARIVEVPPVVDPVGVQNVIGGQPIGSAASLGEPRRGRSRGGPTEAATQSMGTRRSTPTKRKRLLSLEADEAVSNENLLHDLPNEQLSPLRDGQLHQTQTRGS